jgi:hypothetical protein
MKKSRESKNNCVLVVLMIWIDNLSIGKEKNQSTICKCRCNCIAEDIKIFFSC